jgi:molybdopterin molybdotransferase
VDPSAPSLEHHLKDLLGGVGPLEPLDINLAESRGCQLAVDVAAPRPLPHFAASRQPGYAVRSADLTGNVSLKVVDHVSLGFRSTQPVYAGVAVRVDEGVLMPTGADCVVPLSMATGSDRSTVAIAGSIAPGDGVAAVGATAAAGERLLVSGSFIDARAIGLLASLGQSRVLVRPRPRVVIVTVGSGLLRLGATLTEGLSYDATGVMLASTAEESGAQAYRVGPVDEDPREVRDTLEDQLVRADLLVVAGGIEGASRDVHTYLTSTHLVSYDEGTTSMGPFGHGVIGDERIPCLSLPADPTRAAILFGVLAVPMIRAMRGVAHPAPMPLQLAQPVRRTDTTQLLLVASPDMRTAYPLPGPGLSLVDFVRADALIRVLPGADDQPAGSQVPGLPLRSSSSEAAR